MHVIYTVGRTLVVREMKQTSEDELLKKSLG